MELTIDLPETMICTLHQLASDRSNREHRDISQVDLVRWAIIETYSAELSAAALDQEDTQ